MPIINIRSNPRSSNSIEEQNERESELNKEFEKEDKSGFSKIILISIFLLLIVGISAYLYIDLQDNSGTAKSTVTETTIDPELIILDIENYAKLSAIASLAKKEIHNLVLTITPAREAGHQSTIETTEVILDVRKKEFAELRQKLVSILEELYHHHLNNATLVNQQFQDAITEATNKQSSERARLLEIGIKAIENVPPIIAPKVHFMNILDEQL